MTSPRPSSSVCSGWQLPGSVPEISSASRRDPRPPPFAGGLLWAGAAVLSGLAASVVSLVRPAGHEGGGGWGQRRNMLGERGNPSWCWNTKHRGSAALVSRSDLFSKSEVNSEIMLMKRKSIAELSSVIFWQDVKTTCETESNRFFPDRHLAESWQRKRVFFCYVLFFSPSDVKHVLFKVHFIKFNVPMQDCR